MRVYRPVNTRNITSHYVPAHRLQMARILEEYDAIAGFITLVILIVIVAPIAYHTRVFTLWALAYAAYLTMKVVLQRKLHERAQPDAHVETLVPARVRALLRGVVPPRVWEMSTSDATRLTHLTLAVVLTLGALLFSYSVIRTSHALGLPVRDADTIWLLFAVPLIRTARYGSRNWIVAMTLLAVSCNAAATLLGEPASPQVLRLIVLEALWLLLICLLPAVLARYLADCWSEMNAAMQIGNEIAGLRTTSLSDFAHQTTAIIAKTLGYDHVNILMPTSDDEKTGKGLRFIGASSEAGQDLVDSGFILAEAAGINGRTAVREEPHLVNDVHRDRQGIYVWHRKFHDTRAECAIPLMHGGTLLGVLDVQSRTPYVFSEESVSTLRHIAPQLAVALDNVRNLAHSRGLSNITQTIGRRLLSYHDLRSMLQEIVKVASDVLEADIVVLYPHNPRSGQLDTPVVASNHEVRVADARSAMSEDSQRESAVMWALRHGKPQYYLVGTPENASVDAPQGPGSTSSFVVREQIRSVAVLPLRMGLDAETSGAGGETFGVIFVNYHKQRLFTAEYRAWCAALSDLAALAIQTALLQQRVASEEYANLWSEIHDGLAGNAGMARMLFERIMATFKTTGTVNEIHLATADELIHQLQRQVNYLVEIWRDRKTKSTQDVGTFFEEIVEYASLVQKTLDIPCEPSVDGHDHAISSEMRHDARMVMREAVHNAWRHGRPSLIQVRAVVRGKALVVRIKDDGKGFQADQAAARGILNMRRRTHRWGGDARIRSATGRGTVVFAIFPLRPRPLTMNEDDA